MFILLLALPGCFMMPLGKTRHYSNLFIHLRCVNCNNFRSVKCWNVQKQAGFKCRWKLTEPYLFFFSFCWITWMENQDLTNTLNDLSEMFSWWSDNQSFYSPAHCNNSQEIKRQEYKPSPPRMCVFFFSLFLLKQSSWLQSIINQHKAETARRSAVRPLKPSSVVPQDD